MTSPVLNFGRFKGMTVDKITDDYYIEWLSNPYRKIKDKPFNIDNDIFEAAKEILAVRHELKERQKLAARIMGGHKTGYDQNIFIIEMEGDCHSKSGTYILDNQIFKSLDLALEAMAEEYPIEKNNAWEDEQPIMVRQAPDPEDDKITIWEVTPEGFRRPVWLFAGWHHSADDYACGQGKLPGDEEDLYSIACRDY